MKVLPYNGVIGGERRPLYFLAAYGLPVVDARIISFGACNFACPYCKRDGAFRGENGSIVSSVEASMEDILVVCDDAIARGQVVRLSGGDPVMFQRESLQIAEYCASKGVKISMAHNGSSPEFARRMARYLSSAAIDLKGLPHDLGKVAGIGHHLGEKMFWRSLEVQRVLSEAGVLVDVRTPIFGTTTLDDMLQMAEYVVQNDVFWTWRMYKPVTGCDWIPPRKDNVIWMIGEVKKAFPGLKIGLRAKWEPSGFIIFQEV